MPALSRDHARKESSREVHRRLEVDIDHRVDLDRINLVEERARRQDAGVVDEDVNVNSCESA
jgi:hypothetical protein